MVTLFKEPNITGNKVNISTYCQVNKLKANGSLRTQSYVAAKTRLTESYMVHHFNGQLLKC